jgi:ribosomal protein L11 methyltransferase
MEGMHDTYFTLRVDLPESEAEIAESLLHDAGALGLEVRDSECPLMPGVEAPKPFEATLIAFFKTQEDGQNALKWIQENHPQARVLLEEKQNQDWSNEWKSRIRSVTIGRLWVGPPWEEKPSDKVCVVVEPKMAFGTGDHPTTSLCLEAVDDYLATHPGAKVLDVGTGTGILAIAAKKLGAGEALGIDNDAISVTLAHECAFENKVEGLEFSGKNLDEVQGTFDLVLANILANTLIEMAPHLAQKMRDVIVLSGILTHQEAEVEKAFLAQGLVKLPSKIQGEWVRLMFSKAK